MNNLNVNEGGLIIKWTLENFHAFPEKAGQRIYSPDFKIHFTKKCLWYIALERTTEGIVILLEEKTGDCKFEKFKFSVILTVHNEKKASSVVELESLDNELLFIAGQQSVLLFFLNRTRSNFLFEKVSLTFHCHFWLPNLRSKTMVFCALRTLIEVNKLLMPLKISNFSKLMDGLDIKEKISAAWEYCDSFQLVIRKSKKNCTLSDLKITMESGPSYLNSDVRVSCKVVLLNNENKEIATSESIWTVAKYRTKHSLFFTTNEKYDQIPMLDLLPDDLFLIHLNFEISSGKHFTCIEETKILPVEN